MALILITVQDNENGEVNISFTAEPAFDTKALQITPAQNAATIMLNSIAAEGQPEKNLIELVQ